MEITGKWGRNSALTKKLVRECYRNARKSVEI